MLGLETGEGLFGGRTIPLGAGTGPPTDPGGIGVGER